jgi:polyribonucleotide nucleotidyltransferase
VNPNKYTMELGGRTMTLETGVLAKQASGSCLVRYGDTVVLTAVTGSASPREGVDFFPLTVDYEERLYAAGRIPGNWFRREGRPTTKAILSARLTDRPIRPLFPDGYRNDVQIVVTVMSIDGDNVPEIMGIVGASAALTISDVPFEGPIGAVIVGRVDGAFVINPTAEQAALSDMHLTVAATEKAVLMVEAGAKEVPEETMLEAILFGHDVIKNTIIPTILKMQQDVGKPKREVNIESAPELEAAIKELASAKLRTAVRNPDKLAREEAVASVGQEVQDALAEQFPAQQKKIAGILKSVLKKEVRKAIIEDGIRPDGRGLAEVRPIDCMVDLLPRTHGSGLFQRGQTQVLSVTTLGTLGDVQELDDLSLEESKRYMHHYNFPPFSVGEARPMRGPGRREIGHGALAERALEPVIPAEDVFPYAIRVVSEVLESNGSTSMGSVCGSTLSLMAAGVPIKSPVAGVAMGLVEDAETGRYAVLTDIQGIEDALGDMDFKVAGTAKGVTALQMDMKISGTGREILGKALSQAKEGRMFIMGKMLEVMPEPRQEMSAFAPRIIIMKIHPDKIREVIGKGGSMINKIIDSTKIGNTKVEINIEDDGTIHIASVNEEAGMKAVRMIEALTKDPEPGSVYMGKVTRLMNFGAFVEILPGKEGLVHISQLAEERVNRVEDVVNVGDEIMVKITEIDKLGRINLSRKEVLREEKGLPPSPAQPAPPAERLAPPAGLKPNPPKEQ